MVAVLLPTHVPNCLVYLPHCSCPLAPMSLATTSYPRDIDFLHNCRANPSEAARCRSMQELGLGAPDRCHPKPAASLPRSSYACCAVPIRQQGQDAPE